MDKNELTRLLIIFTILIFKETRKITTEVVYLSKSRSKEYLSLFTQSLKSHVQCKRKIEDEEGLFQKRKGEEEV